MSQKQQMLILKDEKLAERLVMSSHVPTLKHKVKQQHITRKQLFQLLRETNKQLFTGHVSFF